MHIIILFPTTKALDIFKKVTFLIFIVFLFSVLFIFIYYMGHLKG